MNNQPTFQQELERLINRFSIENGSNTPDFILAQYLMDCLESFNNTIDRREQWYGRTIDQSIDEATPFADEYDEDLPF